MRIAIKSFWPAIVWLILSSIAFCLPGQVLPEEDWFGIIQLDKWIHVGLFTVMVFLWCLPLFHRPVFQRSLPKLFTRVSIAALSYGILMEFIQHFLISNRSFDVGDIAADAVGCLIGFFFVKRQWRLS